MASPDWKGWAELENDPAIFSTLLREWGVSKIHVNEVVPLDSIFDISPESVYGLIFLSRWSAPETPNESSEGCHEVWFANQVRRANLHQCFAPDML
jgi:ubiquitin carboxyl-terminal hydrolase L5